LAQRSPEARYQEIERWLRRRVLRSAPGDPLPSESELAARFGVSRMTARQAVQNLAAEGLVQRRRGAGTFVAPRPIHRHVGSLMSFTEDMRRRGMKASSRLLEAGLRPATTADLDALRLPDGTRVVAIARLRGGGGAARPLAGSPPTTPLGLGPDPAVERVTLAPADRLLLYTDGLVEARDGRGRPFEVDDRAAAELLATPSLDQALDWLVASLLRHAGGRLDDDLALVLAQPRRLVLRRVA
jgi:DNA-binding transcriptional regulator YhcF (GntR family)